MMRLLSAAVLATLILSAAATAQDVPPLPKDADALKKAGVLPKDPPKATDLLTLGDDLVLLQEKMAEVGTPKHCVHNKYSFSAYIAADRLGQATTDKAFAMAEAQGKKDKAKKLVGATFSCYKVGTHFTHVIFHFEGTTAGGPLGEPAEFSAGVVQNYLLSVNDDGARRAPGTTIPGDKK